MTDHEKHLQELTRIACVERRIGQSYDETNPKTAAKHHAFADALDHALIALEHLPLLLPSCSCASRSCGASEVSP